MSGDAPQSGEFAREASAEERAFHASQASSGGDSGNREPREAPAADFEPREPRESREPREPREQRPEGGSQAPLDLPPPPASKPFVVWSSSPEGSSGQRDE